MNPNGISASPKTFQAALLGWHKKFGRHDLPWQKLQTPYRVWISEIMLQQTQVSTALKYYSRFLTRFPKVSALASASQDEVMAQWSGLGYYSRARHLHQAAKIICNKYAGALPTTFDELLALPGVGRSTAGAILALSNNQRHPILDGNVKRVLTRHFAIAGRPNTAVIEKTLWALADRLTPTHQVANYTQAIMDLGATVCMRSQPTCAKCPLNHSCLAFRTNTVLLFPSKRRRTPKPTRHTVMLVALNDKKQVLLEKKPNHGIWGGLWSLPEVPTQAALRSWINQHFTSNNLVKEKLREFTHGFSHYNLLVQPIVLRLGPSQKRTRPRLPSSDHSGDLVWKTLQNLSEMGLPAPVRRLLEQVEPISK